MRCYPFAIENTRLGQREGADASRGHSTADFGSFPQERQQSLGCLKRLLRAAADDKRIEGRFIEALGLDRQPDRRPYGTALLREIMNVVAALTERPVRSLEDGH